MSQTDLKNGKNGYLFAQFFRKTIWSQNGIQSMQHMKRKLISSSRNEFTLHFYSFRFPIKATFEHIILPARK